MSRMTAFGAALALALIGLPRTGGAADSVTLQLSGPVQFEYAGYYAALWQGFYRDAGLDVTIRPSGLTPQTSIDPVREVTEGRAQFGVGTMQLVIRRAQGLPVLLVAPIFQQSGAAIYYRADTDFSSPTALVNGRLGRLPASDILDIELVTALRGEGIDPAKIKSVSIAQKQIVPALAERTIDAAIGSAWNVPWQAHERGLVLKSFSPANYRVEYYGDSLFTMQRYAAAQPQTVARFRAASLKGWAYALEHPDAVLARLAIENSPEPPATDMNGLNRYQADVARRLARSPDVPLGYSTADRWTQIQAGMLGAGVLQRGADLGEFVYTTPGQVEGGGLATIAPVVGALGVAVAAVGAALWFSLQFWRRRAQARARPASTEPPLPWTTVLGEGSLRAQPVPRAEPATPSEAIPRPEPARPPPPASRRTPPAPAPLPAPPPIDLNVVLAPLERRIRQRVRGKVRLRFSLLPELWRCRTEGGAVAAAVLDLVGAATAAMEADGTLIVGTRNFAFTKKNIADLPGGLLGEFVRITVRDNGPGLSEEQFAQITDPSTTARPAIPRAAAVMQRLGGFLRVETAEEIGTAVHLYFARVADADSTRIAEATPRSATAQVAE